MGEKIKTSEISEILETICAQNELEWRKLNVRFISYPPKTEVHYDLVGPYQGHLDKNV